MHYEALSARLRPGSKTKIEIPLKVSAEIMKLMKLAASVCTVGFLAVGALAQDKPGHIASLEFQTPKNGMVKQYEEGRKAKAAWHKQQKDKDPLFVAELLTGEHTGTYIVGRFGIGAMKRGQVFKVLTTEQQTEVRKRVLARHAAEQEQQKKAQPLPK